MKTSCLDITVSLGNPLDTEYLYITVVVGGPFKITELAYTVAIGDALKTEYLRITVAVGGPL